MEFQLTDEHEAVRTTAREFAARRVKPIAAQIDKEARYPKELVDEMAQLGLLGMEVEEAWDGSEFDTISYVIAMEEISAACASLSARHPRSAAAVSSAV